MINAVIIGASGYTGAELIRLLSNHSKVKIAALVAESNAGKKADELYSHLYGAGLPDLVTFDEVDFTGVDVAFCCLPHATTHNIAKRIPESVVIIDLSADFRIDDATTYEAWYAVPHTAAELQANAVYGLTEHARDAVRRARLIACPGCYPTSMLLPLLPLLRQKIISGEGIIVDAKSGITGAGRGAKTANLFTEVNDSVRPYGIGGHRHVAEVEQELSKVAGEAVQISFTPQVVPMNRGILSCIYATFLGGKTIKEARKALTDAYRDDPFVVVLPEGKTPQTRDVMGSNQCRIALFEDRVAGRIIVLSVIDNLVKGASGQAVQNMNIRFGFSEAEGLESLALFP